MADTEMDELAEGTGVVVRAGLDELARSGVLPLPEQWARAQALPVAQAWISRAAAMAGGEWQIGELQLMVEGVTKRWAELILTGDTEAFEREEMARRERGQG